MSEIKRYCGRAAAGSETAAMNPMVEWHEDGGDDQSTPMVFASDYDALAADLASVKAERDSEIARVHDERSEKYQLELRILDLLAERDRLREALKFYATKLGVSKTCDPNGVIADSGDRARAALKGVP